MRRLAGNAFLGLVVAFVVSCLVWAFWFDRSDEDGGKSGSPTPPRNYPAGYWSSSRCEQYETELFFMTSDCLGCRESGFSACEVCNAMNTLREDLWWNCPSYRGPRAGR